MNEIHHTIGASELLSLYGRLTPWHNRNAVRVRSNKAAQPQKTAGNHWSSSENSSNNCWNVNFNDGNTNNNNKNNSLTVRPAVAHKTSDWILLRDTVEAAYLDCCRGKLSSKEAQAYIPTADEDLDKLTDELITRNYSPGPSTCFLVRYPKYREVFAAAFRDRIMHHWVCMRLEPYFEMLCEEQGNVTHNCRKGFGVNTAVKAVAQGIKDVTFGYSQDAWIFRGDLVGFFMSINRRMMCDKLLAFIDERYRCKSDKEMLKWLVEVIVMHQPAKLCVLNSNPKDWKHLSANKSLFRSPEGKGTPIGNLTTQLFANFFMSEFDGWIQERLKAAGVRWHYTRFVDDFIIVCNDKKKMLHIVKEAEKKLASMDLQLHKNKRYCQKASHGVLFVGTYIHYGRHYLSNRVVGKMTERIHNFDVYLSNPDSYVTTYELEKMVATINSYLGFCRHHKTWNIIRNVVRPFLRKHNKYFKWPRKLTKIQLTFAYRTIIK